MANYPKLRDPLIDGILRKGETLNLISAAKAGKTYLAIGLAISLATGRKWLDRFDIPNPGRVLYVDCELHQETFADRLCHVCAGMGMVPTDLNGKLSVLSLRGRLQDVYEIRQWCKKNAQGYSAIVIDAFYRVQPPNTDENSTSDVTRAFNAVDQITTETPRGRNSGSPCFQRQSIGKEHRGHRRGRVRDGTGCRQSPDLAAA